MDWPECLQLTTADLGRLGESLVADFLARQGAVISARNLRSDAGEIDLLARIDGLRTAVEVRSVRRHLHGAVVAVDAFDQSKAAQVQRVAASVRCTRIDLVSVCFHPGGVDLHWIPRVV